MSAPPALDTGAVLAGHNRISTQALTSTAKAAAAEYFGVPAQQIRVLWRDDQGLLALSLSLPIALPPLNTLTPAMLELAGGTVWQRAHAAKPVLLQRVAELTGSRLSRVDIRITGALPAEGRRVR
ncbi:MULTISPECIES: hypothetical protein [unclassified Arthrobacter]|uniref:hypothetical protein n=1 Tax=unclassified Arthrobacter TaxID=235627 RepID=UPI001D13EE78|nr:MULTISPECIES: hypothetical protein [unclassified Arthrobacter]MCC3275728.1 hypothetical protein [Arthrobacter sp. zg-Y20]MCC3278847.1 hypothetical protein [Arthrobacter sp. zg-Y40]MCC9177221.1 hypothetical protein [Arthrobacter sp. zg-Y750]MDK1315885.1 hypothetical protein [Arthrobacter sp. zg.Y20]MDK1326080.1 hypothetical protein [Arthrobacter sp. zg-Y1143]